MANLIQIKRSRNTSAPASLADGELAYTANGDVLYIGSNTTLVAIGGKRNPGFLTANQALVVNATSYIDAIKVANATIDKIYANGSFGTANQYLASNSTGGSYWAPSITSLDGLSDVVVSIPSTGQVLISNSSGQFRNVSLYGDITLNANGLVSITAGNGITSNSTGVHVVAGTGVISNSTGVHIGQPVGITDNVIFNDVTVNGNTTIGNTTSDTVVVTAKLSSDIIPSANVTYSLGNNTLRFLEIHAQNTHSEYMYVDKDVSISGNLVVSGALVTINVATISVTDSLIQLASNNTTADTLDIGFYGNYQVDGGNHEHTGLFRDATTDTYKLFKGLTVAPQTTIDINGAGYTQATLESYLASGGLISNSTAVTLTANSTVAVNMTANSLSLSTALPGSSGGTGLSSYTTEDILVANSTNGFRKLALGSEGHVLQSNGTAVIYSTMDGGVF